MAEESTRRSARSTKGQHTKTLDDASPEPKSSKSSKKQSKGGQEAAEADEPEEVIRCVCGFQEDDDSLAFISCDRCEVWQHNVCMDITANKRELNKLKYLCEQCNPKAHQPLLDAIHRGERPWELRGGPIVPKKKGPSKSKTAKATKELNQASPTPATGGQAEISKGLQEGPNDGVKRKRATVDADGSPAVPNKLLKSAEQPSKSKRASQSEQIPDAAQSLESKTFFDAAKSIDALSQKPRKSIASDLKKKLSEQIKEAASQQLFRIPDEHTADSLGEDLALRVEHAVFLKHSGKDHSDLAGSYKNQYIMIRSNIPKNMDLVLGLAKGSITPELLSRMSSKDMASEEQKKRDEMIQQENEKQAMLMKDEGAQHIRRTHKGEEVVDDSASHFKGDSISTVQVPRRKESIAENEQDSNASLTEVVAPEAIPSPSFASPALPHSATESARSPSQRRQSSTFDIQDVWKSGGSPNGEQGIDTLQQPQEIGAGFAHSRTKAHPTQDADIDRLLAEDDDAGSYSPADTGTDMQTFWHGIVDMPIDKDSSIASFHCGAHLIAGSDLSDRVPLAEIYPPKLEIHGRIPAGSADQYLTSLSAARGLDVTVHNLVPNDNPKDQEQFDKLFEYLLSRQRFGVVGEKTHRPNVRDVYIIPVEAGASKIPDFLDRLATNTIEQPRPQKLLLIVFVMKWLSNPVLSPTTVQTPRSAMGPSATQAAPAMSPTSAGVLDAAQQMPHHFQQPRQSLPPGSLPGNPYEAQQEQRTANAATIQMPEASQAHTDALNRMRDILGDLVNAPVTQQLLTMSGMAFAQDQDLLFKLRKMYEDHPEAQTDFNAFQRYLAQ